MSYRDECFDQIGLKASQRIPLLNGSLECEFRKYEIFEGRYRAFREEGEQLDKPERRDERRPASAVTTGGATSPARTTGQNVSTNGPATMTTAPDTATTTARGKTGTENAVTSAGTTSTTTVRAARAPVSRTPNGNAANCASGEKKGRNKLQISAERG